MRQNFFLSLAIALLLQCWVQPGKTLSESARLDVDCGRLAIAAFHSNDNEEALARWNKLLQVAKQKDPGGMWHAVSLRNLSEIHFSQMEYDKAKDYLEQELDVLRKIDPAFADLAYDYLYLGRIEFSKSRFDSASKYLKEGLDIVRQRPCDRSLIPDLLTFNAAIAEIRADHQSVEVYMVELKKLLMDKAASNSYFQCASHLEQSSANVSGAARKAITLVEDTLLEESTNATGLGGYQREVFDLNNRLSVFGTSAVHKKAAYSLAIKMAHILELNAPGSSYQIGASYSKAATLANESGMWTEAKDAWAKALYHFQKSPGHEDDIGTVTAMLGLSGMIPGDYDTVLKYCPKVLSYKLPDVVRNDVSRCLIASYENLKNEVERKRYLSIHEKAYDRKAAWKKKLREDVSIITAYGAPRSALELLEYIEKRSQCAVLDPADEDLRVEIANKFLERGDHDNVARAMKGVQNATNKALLCTVLCRMGGHSLELAQSVESQKYFEKALALSASTPSCQEQRPAILYRLAMALVTHREYERAEDVLKTALPALKKKPIASLPEFHIYRLMSECAVYKGEEQRAFQLLEKMIDSGRRAGGSSEWVAEVYYTYDLLHYRRYAEAERRLRSARIKIEKAEKSDKMTAGGIWTSPGMWLAASNNYLAISLLEQGKLAEALSLVQAPYPKNAPMHFWVEFREGVKGRILSLMGRHSEAQQTFDSYLKTISKVPPSQHTNYATSLYWQGLDWLAQKQSAKAQQCFARALKLYAPYQQYPYEFRAECTKALDDLKK